MKKILITGCAGFIGSHLAEFYLKKGDQVFGIDNFCTGTLENILLLQKYPHFHFKEIDVCQNWNSIHFKLEQNSFVFHLASPAAVNQYQALSLETLQANSVGLQQALQFADRYKARLVFSSTSEIYGSPQISPQPESYWGHVNSFGERSCYDESKRFGETLIYNWNKRFKTQHGLVRIFNTYGPRMNLQDGRVLIQFLRQALDHQNLRVFGDGQQTRSFCYIEDLIQGLNLYANSNLIEPINLGHDEEIKILALAKLIIQLTNSRSSIQFEKLPADDPPQRRPEISLARQKLDYNPQIKLKTGIQKIVEALKQN